MVNTQIFVEGGSNNSDSAARRGFSDFFKRAGIEKLPRVVICGSRGDAIRSYRNRKGLGVLLVDSEDPVTASTKTQHLLDREDVDHKHKHQLAEEEIFFMIEAMESWLIADIESIASKHTKVDPKPAQNVRKRVQNQVEKISKRDSDEALKKSLPENLGKGRRMELMGLLDPEIVMHMAPEANALILHLRETSSRMG
jgi:Domain of unknown function (DUF4276)